MWRTGARVGADGHRQCDIRHGIEVEVQVGGTDEAART
jgi:hypothetical protein